MGQLSPFVVIILCLLGAAGAVVGGAALYRLMNPNEYDHHMRTFSEDQIAYMRQVRDLNMSQYDGRQYRQPAQRPTMTPMTRTMSPSTMM